ncbi:MAG: regulatory protein GemA [Gammaproteobacteria bacterium]|nr:regulatory protein GemA [Gammaproteobacteria bacterium]MCP5443359.1 regulatory protein GemA [Chromatiaceae bacterium]
MRTVRSRLSKRQIVFLHTLKSKNNLSEEDYRYLLKEGAGVCSSTELDQEGLNQVLDLLEQLGFDVGDRKKPTKKYCYRKGMATPPQLKYIEDMARRIFTQGGRQAFDHWLENYFKVSHPQFLTAGTAQRAIEALKGMDQRGYKAGSCE